MQHKHLFLTKYILHPIIYVKNSKPTAVNS